MGYRNEMLDEWVGHVVLVMHLVGPNPTEERWEEMSQDPRTMVDRVPYARTGFYDLVSYDSVGVILATIEESPERFFAPWGAVLELHGHKSEETPDG